MLGVHNRPNNMHIRGVSGRSRANQRLRNGYIRGLSRPPPSLLQFFKVLCIFACSQSPEGLRSVCRPQRQSTLPKPTILAESVHRWSGSVQCAGEARAMAHCGYLAQIRFWGIAGFSDRSLEVHQDELARVKHSHRDYGAFVDHARKPRRRIGAQRRERSDSALCLRGNH